MRERNSGMEHVVFTQYLTDEAATQYVAEQYRMAIVARELDNDNAFSHFDRISVDLARRSPRYTRFVDAYCAIFCRRGALRRKLILLAAILEHTAPYSNKFDRSISKGPIASVAGLFLHGVQFALAFVAGAALLFFSRLLYRYGSTRHGQGEVR